ncbi:MAG: winged helix-turn-helix transcriptional regulator [Bacteroidales bacterium]|nr:winged helix-turn-helix transcriptional regulator [Bacteroidales bacterium]
MAKDKTTQKEIFDYLIEHPEATRQEIAEALGKITEDGIKYHISRLQKNGYLKREGGRKLGRWGWFGKNSLCPLITIHKGSSFCSNSNSVMHQYTVNICTHYPYKWAMPL